MTRYVLKQKSNKEYIVSEVNEYTGIAEEIGIATIGQISIPDKYAITLNDYYFADTMEDSKAYGILSIEEGTVWQENGILKALIAGHISNVTRTGRTVKNTF